VSSKTWITAGLQQVSSR